MLRILFTHHTNRSSNLYRNPPSHADEAKYPIEEINELILHSTDTRLPKTLAEDLHLTQFIESVKNL
jgi:hypothetical protein